jgi:hypothetical protein
VKLLSLFGFGVLGCVIGCRQASPGQPARAGQDAAAHNGVPGGANHRNAQHAPSTSQAPILVGPKGGLNIGDRRVLEAIRSNNPDHYARIVRILEEVPRLASAEVTNWIVTTVGASDVSLSKGPLYTTNPPKLRLSFTLDDTHYSGLVAVYYEPLTLR